MVVSNDIFKSNTTYDLSKGTESSEFLASHENYKKIEARKILPND